MSWKEAMDDAERWLDTLQLRRPAKGETLDLRKYELPFEGGYRQMVIVALGRIMKKRGIDAVLPD